MTEFERAKARHGEATARYGALCEALVEARELVERLNDMVAKAQEDMLEAGKAALEVAVIETDE